MDNRFENRGEKVFTRPAAEVIMDRPTKVENFEERTLVIEEPKQGILKRGVAYAKANPAKTVAIVAGGTAVAYGLYKGGKWAYNKFCKKNNAEDLEEEVEVIVEAQEEKKEPKKPANKK